MVFASKVYVTKIFFCNITFKKLSPSQLYLIVLWCPSVRMDLQTHPSPSLPQIRIVLSPPHEARRVPEGFQATHHTWSSWPSKVKSSSRLAICKLLYNQCCSSAQVSQLKDTKVCKKIFFKLYDGLTKIRLQKNNTKLKWFQYRPYTWVIFITWKWCCSSTEFYHNQKIFFYRWTSCLGDEYAPFLHGKRVVLGTKIPVFMENDYLPFKRDTVI